MQDGPPPPPPPTISPKPAKRRWWQFSLRQMLIVTVGFAVALGFGLFAPNLLSASFGFLIVSTVSGAIVGAIAHDFDRARLLGCAVLLGIVAAQWFGVASSVVGYLRGTLGRTLTPMLGMFVDQPAMAFYRWFDPFIDELGWIVACLSGAVSAFVALKTAPFWHLWAAVDKACDR